jgi:hypothetical protein
MDGARPHDRPELAIHSEVQCVTHQPITGTRKAFDYTGVDFEEQDSKLGWIPVTWGKGGSYSIGIVKWHGATGAESRTHNIAYSKIHTKTTQAMAFNYINLVWPGTDSFDKITWIRSHTPCCFINHDAVFFPHLKTPFIKGAANKTKLKWTEPNEEPVMHAMRLRCTPHTKEFNRDECAKLFKLFGYPGSFHAFLKTRDYPI